MSIRAHGPLWALVTFVLAACEPRQSVETEMYVLELQSQVGELEAQLDYWYTEVAGYSQSISTSTTNLEAALDDLNRRVLDLPAGDPQMTIREVEAAMAVANQRMEQLRTAVTNLSTTVDN